MPMRIIMHKAKKKKSCVALSDRPYSKIKIKKVGSESTQFCSDWVFFEKNDGICTQIWPFWVLFEKIIKKKKNFRPTDPTFSEIPLEGNTAIIFFGLTCKSKIRINWNFENNLFC